MTTFRRSRHCTGGSCVEVATLPHGAVVRSTHNPAQCLEFPASSWAAFLAAVKTDQL
jgi:hypothetical protein